MREASGYSGTPLPRKLGFTDGQTVVFVNLPEALDWLSTAVAFAAVDRRTGWSGFGPPRRYDRVHAFARSRSEMETGLPGMMAAIRPDGAIWVSWPKKAARVETDVTEDEVRTVALPLGLVDVKVCAIDTIWSGLKLVIRKDRR